MINTLDCPNNEKPTIYICNVKKAMRSRADSITSAFVSQTHVETATVSKYLGDSYWLLMITQLRQNIQQKTTGDLLFLSDLSGKTRIFNILHPPKYAGKHEFANLSQ